MMDATTGLLTVLAETTVRGSVLIVIAGLVSLALWRASAAMRHLVWATALAGLLVLPVVRMAVPPVELPFPIAVTDAGQEAGRVLFGEASVGEGRPWEPSTAGPATPITAGTAGTGAPAAGTGVTGARAESMPGIDLSIRSWMVVIWGLAALLLTGPVVGGWIGVRRLEMRSRKIRVPRVEVLASRVSNRVGLRHEPRLLVGSERAMPMTWGILRPAVLLPPEALEWPDARLEAVLLHEYAHVARRDCLTQLVAELARAVHWFNPLVWLAARRLRVERELACDDVALESGARASEYARELLGLVASYRVSLEARRVAVAMARPGQLRNRLLAVLDDRRNRKRVGGPTALRTAAAAALLVVPLAVTGSTQQPPAPVPPREPVSPSMPASSSLPVTRPAARPSPVAQEVTCAAARDGWRSVNHSSDDGRSVIRMTRPGCDLEVRLEGEVELDADAVGIARMGRDARVRIEENDGRRERWLEIGAGPGGAPSFAYRENGRDATFDAAAQAWYRAVLLQLFRRVGFAAEERVAALLRRGSVPAVLEELEQLGSDHVRSRYTTELLEQAQLNEAQFRTVVDVALRRVSSDHYMAEILKAVAAEQPLTAQLLGDYIAASRRIESDHYRTEVLRGVIQSGRLTTPQVAEVITSAGEMSSDHYRAQLLADVADRYALEPAFRSAFLRAAESMESDHYQSETLKHLLQRDDLSAGELADLVRASRMLESDHYQAELLKLVAARGLGDASMSQAFFESAAGLESDHYYLDSMRALIDNTRIAPDLLVTLLEASARELESDHYLADLLIRILDRQTVTGDARAAFLRAMESLESGHYRGSVADALLRAERR
jgi:beta-lactamase regulating signal transducer with metallopeptidase domain